MIRKFFSLIALFALSTFALAAEVIPFITEGVDKLEFQVIDQGDPPTVIVYEFQPHHPLSLGTSVIEEITESPNRIGTNESVEVGVANATMRHNLHRIAKKENIFITAYLPATRQRLQSLGCNLH